MTTATAESSTLPIVIVGSGISGYNTAKAFRKLDPDRPIVIVTRDGGEMYYKPSISCSLSKGSAPESLIQALPEALEPQLKARILTRTPVLSIDRAARIITTDQGPMAYHKLVLALGADSISLPIPGDLASRVLTVNDLDGLRHFTGALTPGGRVVIIGAGLIGCEFANDLSLGGHKVHVIDIAATPLARFVPPDLGNILRSELEAIGVRWHLGCSVTTIAAGRTGTFGCLLSNGETLDADLVLSAVGLRPRTELAHAAGLAVGRGILVDAHLRTSDPDIYALGDCIELDGQLWPFVMPTMHETRALGATLAGTPTPVAFPVMPIVVKTESLPIIIVPPAPGDARSGTWTAPADGASHTAVFFDAEQRIKGFVLLGEATQQKARYLRALGQPAS